MTLLIEHWPNRISFGASAASGLSSLVRDLGAARALVVCGKSVTRNGVLERVRRGLGSTFVGAFTGVEAQNPLHCIGAGAMQAKESNADVLIGVGGGSAIDATKCIAMFIAAGGELTPYVISHTRGELNQRRLPTGGALPQIAVPTTAGSASEVMPTAGCTDVGKRVKLLFWDPELVPKAVVLDSELAVFAGASLTARSGMTAVARCVESFYSAHRQPISTGLALQALRLLCRSLPRSVEEPGNVEARADCQIACLMSGVAAINSMVSVVHAVGHVLGGRFGLQHGVGHSILLPAAVRLLLPSIGPDSSSLLQALGIDTPPAYESGTESAALAIQALIGRLPLQLRLRDAGIGETDLDVIADLALVDYMMPNAPRPVSRDELRSLLQSVW